MRYLITCLLLIFPFFLLSKEKSSSRIEIERTVPVLIQALDSLDGRIEVLQRSASLTEQRTAHLESLNDNYRIEKDLLKETYSTNYGFMSFIITALGGLFAFLAFMGVRDINTIKTEYRRELAELRALQENSRTTAQQFEIMRTRFEQDIERLARENEDQDKRIQLVESMEKAYAHKKRDGNSILGLEHVNAALSLAPGRPDLLQMKAHFLLRLNRLEEALTCLESAMQTSPETAVNDTVECLYMMNRTNAAKELTTTYANIFEKKSEAGIDVLFNAWELYHKGDEDGLLDLTKQYVRRFDLGRANFKRMSGWDLTEALFVVSYLRESKIRTILQNFLWCCDGQITGEIFLVRVG